jgi:hypothetical protein
VLFPIFAENSQGSLLYIKEASVKEIAGDDFAIPAGKSTKHFRQVTFPEVTLLNRKTIKSQECCRKPLARFAQAEPICEPFEAAGIGLAQVVDPSKGSYRLGRVQDTN